jgi:ribosomal protein S18 acetylase RimI-like enzyme
MKERWSPSPPALPPVRIRRGGNADAAFIRAVAAEVFSQFGDYSRILPTWLLHDGVLTHIAEEGDRPIGYTMIGFYAAGPPRHQEFVADLLAIAVAPAAQGKGVGKLLLQHAVMQASIARKRMPVTELRLSVAEPNLRARRLFEQFGFRLVEGEHGVYDGGQRALHMALPMKR